MPTKLTLASDLHSTPANKNIGFPGWPEHNLDCVLVLGGQLTEGGLHRPPFFYFHSSCIANRSLFASRFSLTKDVASRKPNAVMLTVPLSNRIHLPGFKPVSI
jgi:hypothetical protein